MKKNVAVIGVGAVGVEIIKILKERKFPINNLRVFARSRRSIEIEGEDYEVEAIEDSDFSNIDIALFAGTEGEKGASVLYADKFVKKGAVVIDNGSDFRLKKNVPLIVPEINKGEVIRHKGIIANPNCTTIQMVVALADIYRTFGLKEIILSSYQATSGAGRKASLGLWEETREVVENNKDKDFNCLAKKLSGPNRVFGPQIAFNVIPRIGSPAEDGYTGEEWKVVRETHKIFNDRRIKISATCARVPVFTSHCESIHFTTKENASLSRIAGVLNNSAGVEYSGESLCFPLDAEGKDPVYVCRLRPNLYRKKSFWMWCVADNLRKGAALNAVQIAELLL
ncbi:MAG: aspartate-semialdehyde dehydrogenase [Candidatus Omnitrophica bacterium]|nr:aspartate-semialdehyde dehydrogenase [Candidatus Omnitrophota bacterium]MBD3269813.1 aspartate-semialdehyde dehydrogenase [Candidatus Omnitrophota bacterium]